MTITAEYRGLCIIVLEFYCTGMPNTENSINRRSYELQKNRFLYLEIFFIPSKCQIPCCHGLTF